MVASSWTLAINPEDYSLDSQYPAGDKPGTPIEDFPDPVKDLVATATGTSSIELTWTPVPGVDTYNIQGSEDNINWTELLAVSGPPYTAINLQSSTQYWARIFTENENGLGPASNTATATTDTPEPGDPGEAIFYDNFERYAIGQELFYVEPPVATLGGRWERVTGDMGNIKVGSGGRNGGKCLHINFDAGSESYIEQHVRMCGSKSQALQEVWLEFYLMTDGTAYHHPDNDKFMSFHNDFYATGGRPAYGRQSTVFNLQGSGNYQQWGSFSCSHYLEDSTKTRSSPHTEEPMSSGLGGVPPFGHGYPGNYTPANGYKEGEGWSYNFRKAGLVNAGGSSQMAITAGQAGQWIRYRIYAKQNDLGQTNGVMKWWRENTLIQHIENLWRQWDDNYNKSDGFYLGGWRNGGFQSPATWKYDEVSVYNTDPNWTF